MVPYIFSKLRELWSTNVWDYVALFWLSICNFRIYCPLLAVSIITVPTASSAILVFRAKPAGIRSQLPRVAIMSIVVIWSAVRRNYNSSVRKIFKLSVKLSEQNFSFMLNLSVLPAAIAIWCFCTWQDEQKLSIWILELWSPGWLWLRNRLTAGSESAECAQLAGKHTFLTCRKSFVVLFICWLSFEGSLCATASVRTE